MKRIYNISLLLGLLLTFCSCESWLDVSPKSEVKETDLFSKESGFKTALLGQYLNMARINLYGGNLTMGFMDVLAQYYDISSEKSNFLPASKYDYTNKLSKPVVTEVWNSMYEIIANLNNMLENMEKQKSLFTGSNYNIIKGEALGLRAFLHFDLLRMYAPSYVLGKDAPAIPYVDKISHIPFPQLTVSQVTETAIRDLLEAEALLRETDPIGPAFKSYSDQGKEDGEYDSDGGFLDYRRERMNYWAVLATLARVYQYAGNAPKAAEYAGKVTNTNRVSANGEIFKIYSDRVTYFSEVYFNPNENAENFLLVPDARRDTIYETKKYGSIDERRKNWFTYYPNTETTVVAKYMKTGASNPLNIALIRGCEVYYIAAEAAEESGAAFDLLNKVRNAFGISAVYNLEKEKDDFNRELENEYRKSFVAEGQFFYFMKRKNYASVKYSEAKNFPGLYTFPKPDNELEFGNISDK